MSMSQEEIEALMNGAEIEPTESADEISISDDILEDSESDDIVEDNFDELLAGIDGITDDGNSDDVEIEEDNFDDILAGIDGISDDEPVAEAKEEHSVSSESDSVDESKYPLPVENEHKVVNQLNEVAEDSEEKASQIFDVLSFILDENNEIQNYNKEMCEFIDGQAELLESLSNKFPNVSIFNENLELAKKLSLTSKELSAKVDSENNKVFEAMELMQYHDINRQKIERVMSVIRKLSTYLNGIFQDDSDKPEVQIAKHISGDGTDSLAEDDLEALISEFGNEG